jgi:hypothetical protein
MIITEPSTEIEPSEKKSKTLLYFELEKKNMKKKGKRKREGDGTCVQFHLNPRRFDGLNR